VIVATPIFGARLKAGELVHVEGGTWEVCCATGLTATLRVVPGRLMQTGDVDLAGMAEDIANLTADVTSTLYDGGGTANALQDTIATSTLPTGAAVIDCDGSNAIDIEMFNATAAEAFTLMVSEYSASTPTIATLIRQTPVPFTAADQDRTVDRACVSLTTGTEIYAKPPVRVAVTPGAYVQLSIVENITGANYARYQLRVLDREELLALGTGTMATSRAVTVATDDTQFGAVGAAADVDGNVHGQLRSIGEAVEVMDDWDESDRAKVNPIAGQAGVAANSGNKDALTQRVVIATDDIPIAAINTLLTTQNTILGGMVPTGSTALASAATTGVGTVDVITLAANTIYVDITFDTAWHYATPGTSPPGTTEGAKYAPGITVRIHTFKTTNLYVESVAGAGAYHATCYTRA